ncbi:hypothetical protein [Streptomyces sp. NPDC090112]|uniref:hypothetical protein n=1 Tax=Streptomyces sp. NPDC090112 TaxID=3365949 RepID=UPI003817B2F4
MNQILQDDAWRVLDQYGTGRIADPYDALDAHRIFAYELMLSELATLDECREVERALVAALNAATRKRAKQSINDTLPKEL